MVFFFLNSRLFTRASQLIRQEFIKRLRLRHDGLIVEVLRPLDRGHLLLLALGTHGRGVSGKIGKPRIGGLLLRGPEDLLRNVLLVALPHAPVVERLLVQRGAVVVRLVEFGLARRGPLVLVWVFGGRGLLLGVERAGVRGLLLGEGVWGLLMVREGGVLLRVATSAASEVVFGVFLAFVRRGRLKWLLVSFHCAAVDSSNRFAVVLFNFFQHWLVMVQVLVHLRNIKRRCAWSWLGLRHLFLLLIVVHGLNILGLRLKRQLCIYLRSNCIFKACLRLSLAK